MLLKKSMLMSSIFVLTSLLFVGCATKNYTASTTPKDIEKHNALMKKTINYVNKVVNNSNDFGEQETVITPKSKVFILNVHPDEKARSRAMFNYAIKLMNEKGICYKNKYDKKAKPICAKPKIVITEDGESADLILDTLEGKMNTSKAFTAVRQFNKKYFPGFFFLKSGGFLTAYTTLKITNELLDDKFYSYCTLDGAFEDKLKRINSILVDDPDKADYILIYQTLGCSEKYLGHQPESLLKSIKNTSQKNNDMSIANNNNFNTFVANGSFGLLNGYNYGSATSAAFNTYFTPTVIGFSVLGMLGSGYTSTQGVAYEYVLIDKKDKVFYGNIAEETQRKTRYYNGMFNLVRTASDDIITGKSSKERLNEKLKKISKKFKEKRNKAN